MADDPKNLNIPFPPRDWFWLHALIVISVFAAGLYWLTPEFGLAFAVNAALLLPAFGPWLLSGRFHDPSSNPSVRPLGILLAALAFGYLKLCKDVLSPAILSLL